MVKYYYLNVVLLKKIVVFLYEIVVLFVYKVVFFVVLNLVFVFLIGGLGVLFVFVKRIELFFVFLIL